MGEYTVLKGLLTKSKDERLRGPNIKILMFSFFHTCFEFHLYLIHPLFTWFKYSALRVILTPVGDKRVQLGHVQTYVVCTEGHTEAGDAALSCFPFHAAVYLLTWIRGLVEDTGQQRLKYGRLHCTDIQSPIPSANWTLCMCVCVCACAF